MLFNRDSTIQKCSVILHYFSSQKIFGSLSAVQTTCHTVQTPDKSSTIRPDDVDFRPDPSLHREAYVPACIRPDVSVTRPDDIQ
jgi:hypothetical protein